MKKESHRKMVDERAGDPVIVRHPEAGDGEGLAQCWLDAGIHYAQVSPDLFQTPQRNGLAEWLEANALDTSIPDRGVFVAEVGGEIAGFVTGSIQQPIAEAARQFVRDVGKVRLIVHVLAVRETHRRAGVGTRLMTAIESWARGQGASVAVLDTYAGSELSVPFYERGMGYAKSAIRFRKEL